MSLLDYRIVKTRWTWRVAAALALAIGLVGLYLGHRLTLEVVYSATARPDATHTFLVMDRFYVSFGLGLRRNLTLLLSGVLTITASVVLLHRELRWYFWERHLGKSWEPQPDSAAETDPEHANAISPPPGDS